MILRNHAGGRPYFAGHVLVLSIAYKNTFTISFQRKRPLNAWGSGAAQEDTRRGVPSSARGVGRAHIHKYFKTQKTCQLDFL